MNHAGRSQHQTNGKVISKQDLFWSILWYHYKENQVIPEWKVFFMKSLKKPLTLMFFVICQLHASRQIKRMLFQRCSGNASKKLKRYYYSILQDAVNYMLKEKDHSRAMRHKMSKFQKQSQGRNWKHLKDGFQKTTNFLIIKKYWKALELKAPSRSEVRKKLTKP